MFLHSIASVRATHSINRHSTEKVVRNGNHGNPGYKASKRLTRVADMIRGNATSVDAALWYNVLTHVSDTV
jgi:hypothetical protein